MTARTLTTPRLSLSRQAAAAIAAIAAAVVLPQLFHAVGILSGYGAAPAAAFLPMHLPVMLVGLLAGPFAGMLTGLCAPLLSFLLTGMPAAALLPFMVTELAAYGLIAGLLRSSRMPSVLKVLTVQAGGRAVRAAVTLLAVYILGSESATLSAFFSSIVTALPGIVLQWVLLPLVLFRVEHR